MTAEIIDLALVSDARKTLKLWLDQKGIAYFLRRDPRRPFELEPKRVELVVKTAARNPDRARKPHLRAVAHARQEIRRELIRRVVAEMLQTGL